MKVTLVCCGRLENRYAIEFVEYYKNLGFSHIFICDNNHDGEEYFEDVLQQYIDEGFVTIENYRNKEGIQVQMYLEMYNKISSNYDYGWIAFFDFDEFLTLVEDKNIKEYLNRDCFKNYNQILINWKIYGDNGLVYDDGRPCLERFTTALDINTIIPSSSTHLIFFIRFLSNLIYPISIESRIISSSFLPITTILRSVLETSSNIS